VNARFAPRVRRLPIVCSAVLAAGLLGACGQISHPTTADNEGVYVDAGPLTYQVQLSRQLNPYSIEDRTYLSGVSTTAPKPNEEWFGVFLWAKNSTHKDETTTDSFDIVDTQGTKYYPVAINSQINPFAWTAQMLAPKATEPAADSTASFGPTQGGLLLFKLNDSIYSNRPLTLEIHAPGQAQPSTVSLDL
jgi:hypothetical protein